MPQSRVKSPIAKSDPCSPMYSYGIQKVAAEEYLRLAAHKGYLTATVLRVGNAYGTLQSQFRMQGVIGVAINSIVHRQAVRLFGNPNNVRDYIHLEDISNIAVRTSVPRQAFSIVNVGTGVGHSVLNVLRMIEECRGEPIELQSDPSCGDRLAEWVVLDNSKARAEFGWSPAKNLRSGIAGILEECRVDSELASRPAY